MHVKRDGMRSDWERKKSVCDACRKTFDMRPHFVFLILLNPLILNPNILYKSIKKYYLLVLILQLGTQPG